MKVGIAQLNPVVGDIKGNQLNKINTKGNKPPEQEEECL
jgi:hypothetical protein